VFSIASVSSSTGNGGVRAATSSSAGAWPSLIAAISSSTGRGKGRGAWSSTSIPLSASGSRRRDRASGGASGTRIES
jgi:hypothetical protein